MTPFIIHFILRCLLITLIITDIRMKRKLKAGDASIHRVLSANQKREQVFFYIVLVLGLVVPFDWIYLVITILAIAYFFFYTDREIYIYASGIHLRGQVYEFKKIEQLRYERHRLSFDYKNEHIQLSFPLLEDTCIEREIIQKVTRLQENTARKKHYGKNKTTH